MVIITPFHVTYSFLLLSICHCGNLGKDSVSASNDINGRQEAAGIVYVREEELPYDKIPIVLDVANLNLELFYVEMFVDGNDSFREITSREEYSVIKVTCGDDILWKSEDGWECVHAFMHIGADNLILMMGLQRGRMTRYHVFYRRDGEEWKEVTIDDVQRFILSLPDL